MEKAELLVKVTRSHLDRVKRIENTSPTNLIILGNYMYGVSIIDIVTKSKECAKSIQ